ncbi:hypothetical protein AVEN_250799-1 [Araneus ventricosus]|uniref:Uncharacterized protein n=1 Tax=Araneus ventricosus TaxID=182803 RepID=A0A4Y2NNN3_ARAVE|nr:hypothetical protein AVEN_250799-1 [Araneus ventricosus]
MSCCRISKQELASPRGIVPPPVIVRTSFGRGWAVARLLATRTPASVLEAFTAAVIQMTRVPRQGGGRPSFEVILQRLERDRSIFLFSC